jgi:hypothetical protein
MSGDEPSKGLDFSEPVSPKELDDFSSPDVVVKHGSRCHAWSGRELQKLYHLAISGLPIKDICQDLNRTQVAVDGAFSKILLQQIMHSSIKEVAQHYGETIGNLQASLIPPKYHIPMTQMNPNSHYISTVTSEDSDHESQISMKSVESQSSESQCFKATAVFMVAFTAIFLYGQVLSIAGYIQSL